MDMLVTAINRTDELILVGHNYLWPGEGRRVTLPDFLQALALHGAGLESPDVGDADDVAHDVEPDEYAIDVLDGDADPADLGRMTRAELAEAARLHGVVPGRMTKHELIAAIRECTE